MTNNSIPSDLPDYIDPSIDLEKIKKECRQMVKSRAKVSAGVAVVPVPFLDVAVDAGLLTIILPQITERFGLIEDARQVGNLTSKDERFDNIKDRIISFAGLMVTRGMVKKTIQGFGGRIVAKQVTKFVPLGGQMVAASLGYMIFKKIAFDHIDECYKLAKRIQDESRKKDDNNQKNNSGQTGNVNQNDNTPKDSSQKSDDVKQATHAE